MSHFIGLVFEKSINLKDMLEPYNEQSNDGQYIVFEDCTEEIQKTFDSLPEKDERLTPEGEPYPYPRDKEHYPTFESLAEDWFGYRKNEDGVYGYTHNPDAKWDWYEIGNRWDGFILGKDGGEHNVAPFNEVDWDKMFVPKDGEDWNRIPFCLVDTDGYWHEKGEMGWFACVSNEKDKDTWENEVKSYIKHLQELPEEEREEIVVYAVDFHI